MRLWQNVAVAQAAAAVAAAAAAAATMQAAVSVVGGVTVEVGEALRAVRSVPTL